MNESVRTETQISAGGVAFRKQGSRVEVALISVSDQRRWQLPKGLIDPGESREAAARREVREETGLETELLSELDRVDYWFYSHHNGQRVRYHKYVHFYLLRFLSGDVSDHDHEVNEARWIEIGRAIEILTFESDRNIVRMAHQRIQEQGL